MLTSAHNIMGRCLGKAPPPTPLSNDTQAYFIRVSIAVCERAVRFKPRCCWWHNDAPGQ